MRQISVGCFEPTATILEYVTDVVGSGRLSYGPYSKALEEEFAYIHDSRYGVLSASGTDSLRAALHALKIRYGWVDGSEVIVPATTFVATINIVWQLGLKPVLVDVENDHFCIDVQMVQQAITTDTVAIIPVNLLGQPANLSDLEYISEVYDLSVVEDSCETMFVRHMGEPVGTWSDIGVFSFYMAHLITAGVGGIAITQDQDLAEEMRSLVNHGRVPVYTSIDDDDGLTGDALEKMIRSRYEFISPGYSSRITELQAAVALPQLLNYEDMLARRYAIASRLTAGLGRHAHRLQLPAEREQGEHAYMMYALRLLDGVDKWPLMLHLEKNGIETRELLPIVNQPMYAGLVQQAEEEYNNLAVSKDLIKTAFYIGCHQGMTDADADYVCEVVDDFFRYDFFR
jgi:dTDP-4-amino-4,6-dideoxygalactose transaminase